MTETLIPPTPDNERNAKPDSVVQRLLGRITRMEMIVGAVIAVVMLALVIIEPNILEAPFENERTLLFTFGGTALAAIAFVAMLWLKVPAAIRVTVLVVPFVFVNWWLISPYFIDDVVDEQFSTSISAQLATEEASTAPEAPVVTAPPAAAEEPAADAAAPTPAEEPAAAPAEPADEAPTAEEQPAAAEEPAEEEPQPPPSGPVLLGAGQFVGLAGHDGTGDAGLFQNPDGSLVLRFENFDIENGPDLEVYLVPGADQVSLPDGSIHLGALKGNIGDQNYELPPGTELPPGSYTALVWCEAFSVEFVGATVTI